MIVSSLQSCNAEGEKSYNSEACRLFLGYFCSAATLRNSPARDVGMSELQLCSLVCFIKLLPSTNFYCCVCNRTESIQHHQAGQCRRLSKDSYFLLLTITEDCGVPGSVPGVPGGVPGVTGRLPPCCLAESQCCAGCTWCAKQCA